MILLLNGPLGVGKSTLAEALVETSEGFAMVNGDRLTAVNPAPDDPLKHLHAGIVLLLKHHRSFGYRHFVIEHFWGTASELSDLCHQLEPLDADIRCFRLTLPEEENLQRIARRAAGRESDDFEFEMRTLAEERHALAAAGDELGTPFDVSAPVAELVVKMKALLNLEADQ